MSRAGITRRVLLLLTFMMLATGTLAAPQAYKLRVDGLACPFCAYGVEKKLNAIKGVQGVGVDIASGTVTVTMAEGASLDEATAKQAVKDAGFTLRKFEPAQPATQTK